MAQRDVAINLLTKLQDKGFKDLQKQTGKTSKTLDKFGKKLTAAFSVVAITRFVSKSVTAFAENEKALARLGLELDNLKLGFARGIADDFITKLSLATGIADDELNPALQKLVRTTKTLTEGQQLLSLAVDISKQTGLELVTVTNALSRAALGDTKALARLNIGYTTASLKGKEFSDIQSELTKKFGGAALATQGTYATSIDRLKVAFDEAREAIGEGFIKGLEESGMTVDEFIPKIIKLGETIGKGLGKAASVIANIDKKFEVLAKNPIIKTLIRLYEILDTKPAAERAEEYTKAQEKSANAAREQILADFERLGVQIQLTRQEEKNRKLRAAELAALKAAQKKTEADKKRSDAVEKLRKTIQYKFDIEAINQQAALRRNLSASDKDRLLQLIALKTSEYQDDEEAIKTLTAATKGRYDEAMALEQMYALLKAAGFASDKLAIEGLTKLDPKIKFSDNLADIRRALEDLIKGKYTVNIDIVTRGGVVIPSAGSGGALGAGDFRKLDENRSKDLPSISAPGGVMRPSSIDLPGEAGGEPFIKVIPPISTFDPAAFRRFEETGISNRGGIPSNFDPARFRAADEGITINVNVGGSVIAQNDLVQTITDAVYQSQRTGNPLILEAV